MAVITERHARDYAKNKSESTYCLKEKDILTPSARQFFSDQGIKVVTALDMANDKNAKSNASELTSGTKAETSVEATEASQPTYAYVCYETGAHFMHKPEHMTQIQGNQLVVKNHKRIVLRGQIDSMLAQVVAQHQVFKNLDNEILGSDMKELGHWIRQIQRSEILEEPLPALTFMGYDEATQKAMSHDPKRFFGTGHLFGINEDTHPIAVALNVLRAEARKMELTAVDVFYQPKAVNRPDLLMAFNRFSSCIYLMMLKAVSGQYDKSTKNAHNR